MSDSKSSAFSSDWVKYALAAAGTIAAAGLGHHLYKRSKPSSPMPTPTQSPSPGQIAKFIMDQFAAAGLKDYLYVIPVQDFRNEISRGGRQNGWFIMTCFCRDDVSTGVADQMMAAAPLTPPPELGENPTESQLKAQFNYLQAKKLYEENVQRSQSVTESLANAASDVPVFSFNSVGGYCACGETAYVAAAHHVFSRGAKIQLVGGPHIGLHMNNTDHWWGTLYRDGVDPALSKCCHAVAALMYPPAADAKKDPEMTRFVDDFKALLDPNAPPTTKLQLLKSVAEISSYQLALASLSLRRALDENDNKDATIKFWPCVVINVSFVASGEEKYYTFVALKQKPTHNTDYTDTIDIGSAGTGSSNTVGSGGAHAKLLKSVSVSSDLNIPAKIAEKFGANRYVYTVDRFARHIRHPTAPKSTPFILASLCRDELSAGTATGPPPSLALKENASTEEKAAYAQYVEAKTVYDKQQKNARSLLDALLAAEDGQGVRVFSLNSLAGYCSCGTAALRAAAQNARMEGAQFEIVGGPHIGLDIDENDKMTWGWLHRVGVNHITNCCGAAVALANFKPNNDPKVDPEMTRFAAAYLNEFKSMPSPDMDRFELIKNVAKLNTKQMAKTIDELKIILAHTNSIRYSIKHWPVTVVNVSRKPKVGPMQYYTYVVTETEL